MAEYFPELKLPLVIPLIGFGVLSSGGIGGLLFGLALLAGGFLLGYHRYTVIQEAQQADIATRADRAPARRRTSSPFGSSDSHVAGLASLRRPRWPVAVAGVGMVAMACGGAAGATTCEEFMDRSSAERGELFSEVVSDRGLTMGGPQWQQDMQRSVAESYCMMNPDAPLDDGVDFAGVPNR